ncbi:MAG: HIT family protein [Flavobacteriales bacterium]|jgi:histidine triad (HIT) family protein|nr:HIT family protein [Flavobacteriales bacterium]MBT7481551.1 HIT family protein [Flavobacteriales bacterium]
MSSIFTKIVKGKIPCFKITEDDNYLAFLDTFPLTLGHVLVIPKKEIDYLFDLESEEYFGLWKFSQKIAKAMDKVIDCERIGVAVIGLEVPHAHIHLVPINGISDINFERPKKQFTTEQMIEIADKIKQAL